MSYCDTLYSAEETAGEEGQGCGWLACQLSDGLSEKWLKRRERSGSGDQEGEEGKNHRGTWEFVILWKWDNGRGYKAGVVGKL